VVAGPVVIEGRAALADSRIGLIVEKDDIKMRLGVEQRPEGAVHLRCELPALFFVVGHKTEHDAAGDAVEARADEIGPRHGRAEIEQDGNRFLEPQLANATSVRLPLKLNTFKPLAPIRNSASPITTVNPQLLQPLSPAIFTAIMR